MDRKDAEFDVAALGEVEAAYQDLVREEPNDYLARIDLAWCLFMKALHQAGREQLAAELEIEPAAAGGRRIALDGDALDLLRESLRHAITARNLSSNPDSRREADRLRILARMAGCAPLVREAERFAADRLDDIVQAMCVARTSGGPDDARTLDQDHRRCAAGSQSGDAGAPNSGSGPRA